MMKEGTSPRPLEVLPRGVWWAPYLFAGRPVLQAIDRHGNCIKQVRVLPGVDEDIPRTYLEGFLERRDPPALRLLP